MMPLLLIVDITGVSDLSAAASAHESTSTADSRSPCKSPMTSCSIDHVLLHIISHSHPGGAMSSKRTSAINPQ